MGTSQTDQSTRTDKGVSNDNDREKNQIFPKTPKNHQLPSGLGDPDKSESPQSSSGLLRPTRGSIFRYKPRNRQGFLIWKKTRDSLTKLMEIRNQRSSSLNDKRRMRQDKKDNCPSHSPPLLSNIKMSNPVEEQFQQIVGEAEAEAREATYSVNFISVEVPREDEAPL